MSVPGRGESRDAELDEELTQLDESFLKLCAAYYQAGRLEVAFAACNLVENSSPSDDQRTRARKLIEKIKAEAAKRHINLQP